MARTTTFTRGSGCYTCKACGVKTRDDGNGDSVQCHLCTACFELAGYENRQSDNGELTASETEHVTELKAYVASRGGRDAFPSLLTPPTTLTKEPTMSKTQAAAKYLAHGIKAGSNKVSAVRALAAWHDAAGNTLTRREVFELLHAAHFPVSDHTISRQFHLVRRGELEVVYNH